MERTTHRAVRPITRSADASLADQVLGELKTFACRVDDTSFPMKSGQERRCRLMKSVIFQAFVACLIFAPMSMSARAQGDSQDLADEVQLSTIAAELKLQRGRRKSTAGSIDHKLSAPVRTALNEWASLASEHDLSILVPESGAVVVLGSADRKLLSEAVSVLDETWEMLEDLRPEDGLENEQAVLVFLFDEEGLGGGAWGAVLEALVERNELMEHAARDLIADPRALMLRGLPGFLQPTYDMAGNAAAGDDEFRLHNELAHKLTQCVLKSRFGEVPESIRWGLGFLVEQRQFRSIYQLNATGFVASTDHFNWPKKTREVILDSYKEDGWALSGHALRPNTAGRPETSQMITWGALDYLYAKDSENLVAMLDELAGLHSDATGWRTNLGHYVGQQGATTKVLAERLDGIDARKLASHLRRVK